MKDQDNVVITVLNVEVIVYYTVEAWSIETGWTETARKLAENVEPWTGKIPSRWDRYMIFIIYS